MRPHLAFVAAGLALAVPLAAQLADNRTAEDVALEELIKLDEYVGPKSEFSLSVRVLGKLRATFSGIGTVRSTTLDPGDTTSEVARVYSDGYVALDTRTDTDGNSLLDDGRTNTWSYNGSSQVTADESGIRFNAYDSISEGATADASSGASIGIDLKGSRKLGSLGRFVGEQTREWTYGINFGFGLNTLSAKTTTRINATLHTVTDTFSLLGSAVPLSDDDTDNGYAAPSSTTQTVTNADGTTTSQTLDTTTFISNRPESRVETYETSAATVDGSWQVRGGYFTLRSGPWVRWQPRQNLSLNLSAGGTLSVIGLNMSYDESLVIADDLTAAQVTNKSENETFTSGGLFSSLDAEWWLSDRTGFFGGAYYETMTRENIISLDGRSARIEVSSGLGLRLGVTTKF